MLQKHGGIDLYNPGKLDVSFSSKLHIPWLHMSSSKFTVGGGICTAEVRKCYRSGNLKTVISAPLSEMHIQTNCDTVVCWGAEAENVCFVLFRVFLQSSTAADQEHTNLGTHSAVCLHFVMLWHLFWDSDWQDEMCMITWILGYVCGYCGQSTGMMLHSMWHMVGTQIHSSCC